MGELDSVKRGMKSRAAGALERIGEDLLGAGAREAPIEEGTLRGSGNVELVVTPDGVAVTISFNTVYAARQHEETAWNHPKGGKAKFLEDPLKERATTYEHVLAAAVGRGI